MTVVEYLVNRLIDSGATDAFGVPGTVIQKLMYEMDQRKEIAIHLTYHEQSAALASCGYAHASGKLGIAYSTKGPGFTNLITGIAEAYTDSLPVVFLTAHSSREINNKVRIESEQEINTEELIKGKTKYAKRIDSIDDAKFAIDKAISAALEGRKGPAVLDFYSKLWDEPINISRGKTDALKIDNSYLQDACKTIMDTIKIATRPIILIGDGVRFTSTINDICLFAKIARLPILSSRCSQDLCSSNSCYFGYIGSHGLRYSNFILSKTDCIIALGNRLEFPINSETFAPIIKKTKNVWVDVDNNELERNIPNTTIVKSNLNDLMPLLLKTLEGNHKRLKDYSKWFDVCKELKKSLQGCDITPAIYKTSKVIAAFDSDGLIVCDIGNNELLSSRAYAITGNGRPLLHSKSMKTVGSCLCKAIGAYYATRKPVLCITGDQGFQLNVQELQTIKSGNLPIKILLLNNHALGMLRDSEKKSGFKYDLHTTKNSGYDVPSVAAIAEAYGIKFVKMDSPIIDNLDDIVYSYVGPSIIEMIINDEDEIFNSIPKANPCQKFVPEIDEEEYLLLDNL